MPREVPPFPCPGCGGPTHYEADGKRRARALFCDDWRSCGWTTSRSDAAYRRAQ